MEEGSCSFGAKTLGVVNFLCALKSGENIEQNDFTEIYQYVRARTEISGLPNESR